MFFRFNRFKDEFQCDNEGDDCKPFRLWRDDRFLRYGDGKR